MPSTASSWFSATMVFENRGISEDSSRVQAGMLPLVSHKDGCSKGPRSAA